MANRKINWGIIATGGIAHKFVKDLKLVDNAVLYGVASRFEEKAGKFASMYGFKKYYGNYEALACDPEVDVIYIATPHVLHYENTLMCLKAGKAVLCEKPFAMHAGELQEMISEANKQNLFLMEAIWTRFIPATEKLLDLAQSGRIGKVKYIHADFGFIANHDPEQRWFNKTLGGGSLLDIGIYDIFIGQLLLGTPTKINATAQFSGTGADTYCAMMFDFPHGEKALYSSCFDANMPVEAIIYGEKGSLKLHHRFHHANKITVEENNQPAYDIDIPYKGGGYYYEILEVMQCLNNGQIESQKLPHQFSLDLMKTLDAVRQEIGLEYEQDVKWPAFSWTR